MYPRHEPQHYGSLIIRKWHGISMPLRLGLPTPIKSGDPDAGGAVSVLGESDEYTPHVTVPLDRVLFSLRWPETGTILVYEPS